MITVVIKIKISKKNLYICFLYYFSKKNLLILFVSIVYKQFELKMLLYMEQLYSISPIRYSKMSPNLCHPNLKNEFTWQSLETKSLKNDINLFNFLNQKFLYNSTHLSLIKN